MKKIIAVLLSAFIITGGMSALAENETAPSEPEETAAEVSPLPEASVSPSPTDPAPSEPPEPEETPIANPYGTEPPEDTPSAAAISDKETSDKFVLNLYITYHKFIADGDFTIELYSADGTFLGTKTDSVAKGVERVTMEFDVPRYRMGERFFVKLVSGLRSIRYYDEKAEPGYSLEVQTYGYTDSNGQYARKNGCDLDANPIYSKEICMYVNGNFLKDMSPAARVVDGVAMAPVRAVGEAMGLKVKYDKKYDSVVCSVDSKEVIFNANTAYMTAFGQDTYAPHAAVYIEGSLFVPVRTLAEAFGSSLEAPDFDDHLDVIIGESPMVREYRNRTPVNKNGITSRTNYLVWVSKSEYRVRVYEGSQYNWEEIASFPCALGAWDSPTITGQFEYIERTRWDYDTYYVGPVLRFYNGYALHSTLLYYGGGEYDGRVGVNISHGCVRLHPDDINWIADTIPFYTRIYITE